MTTNASRLVLAYNHVIVSTVINHCNLSKDSPCSSVMPQNTPDEDAFMKNLLSSLDSAPQPERPSKLKRTASCSSIAPQMPSKHADSRPGSHSNNPDISMLLDGAENWDWNDMELDFLTPKKPNCVKTPMKVSFFSFEYVSRSELGPRKRPDASHFLSSGLLVQGDLHLCLPLLFPSMRLLWM
jgi:hypothetical protein